MPQQQQSGTNTSSRFNTTTTSRFGQTQTQPRNDLNGKLTTMFGKKNHQKMK